MQYCKEQQCKTLVILAGDGESSGQLPRHHQHIYVEVWYGPGSLERMAGSLLGIGPSTLPVSL